MKLEVLLICVGQPYAIRCTVFPDPLGDIELVVFIPLVVGGHWQDIDRFRQSAVIYALCLFGFGCQ